MIDRRRTAYDFLVEIVEACREPIGKTDLYHKIGTQFNILERWVNAALKFKLIENVVERFRTTEKGINFLKKWAELQTFLKEE